MDFLGVRTTALPGLLCVLILWIVVLFHSLGCDSRCSTPLTGDFWNTFWLPGSTDIFTELICFFLLSKAEASRISRRWQWKDTHNGSARNWPGTAELSDCLHTDETSQSFYLFVFILTPASPGMTVIFFRMSLPCVLQSIGFCGNTSLRIVRALRADTVYKLEICVEWTCFCLLTALARTCCLTEMHGYSSLGVCCVLRLQRKDRVVVRTTGSYTNDMGCS